MRTKIKTDSEYMTAAELRAARGLPVLGYSISEWCAAIGISRATYYKLPERPDVLEIGTRKIITPAASDRWLRRREVVQ